MHEIVNRIIRIKRERKHPVIFSDNVIIYLYKKLNKINRHAISTNKSLEKLPNTISSSIPCQH